MNPLFAGIPLSTLLRAALGKEAAKAPVTKARRPVPAAPPTPPSSSTSSLLPGNRKRCYDCGGGPSGSCKETVTTCGEGERCGFLERKPQPDPRQTKPNGNRESSVCPPASSPYYFSPSGFQNLPGSVWLWADGVSVRVERSVAPSGSWH